MKLNPIEKALMNNPLRSLLQRHYEAPLFERLGGLTPNQHVMEIGCGRGVGTQIILERFRARRVMALDLDGDMLARAQQRLSAHAADPTSRVHLALADAAAIPVADCSFDAVFDFGVIHHVPAWRVAVSEVRRVLRPGGKFFFEEVTRQALNRWAYQRFLRHPEYDRFSADEFIAALESHEIYVEDRVVRPFFGDFVIGVGRRNSARPSRGRRKPAT